jgi:O-antigen ligase
LDPNVAPYPYSTFSHPNSFAGFLLVFVFFLLEHKSKFEPKFFYSSFLLSSINLLLTNSLNVYLTIAVLLILNFKNNLTLGFLFLDFSQRYITHRIELIKSSIQMIKENFFIGVGLNNFIPNLVRYSGSFINSWELQPVHNIFLLVFSETGVVGFLAFIVLLFASLTTYHYALISILITGMADHYWLTLQQNMLLFTYVVALSTIRK